MTVYFTESEVESAALSWLESLGWQIMFGPNINPEMRATKRRDIRNSLWCFRTPGRPDG